MQDEMQAALAYISGQQKLISEAISGLEGVQASCLDSIPVVWWKHQAAYAALLTDLEDLSQALTQESMRYGS